MCSFIKIYDSLNIQDKTFQSLEICPIYTEKNDTTFYIKSFYRVEKKRRNFETNKNKRLKILKGGEKKF